MDPQVPIIGQPQQIQITASKLCVECYPKPAPALFNYKGDSLCPEHMAARKKLEEKPEEKPE